MGELHWYSNSLQPFMISRRNYVVSIFTFALRPQHTCTQGQAQHLFGTSNLRHETFFIKKNTERLSTKIIWFRKVYQKNSLDGKVLRHRKNDKEKYFKGDLCI